VPTLNDIGLKHGTDKSTLRHNYLPLYEQRLTQQRWEPITLLELGVADGASLRMWRDYLPKATIVGLDHNPPITVHGATVIQGEQDDPQAIDIAATLGPFDIVIDDASHLSAKTITSFRLLYQHLKPGGLYVIEDLHSSFWPAIYGDQDADPNPNTPKLTAMQFCKQLADETQFDPTQHPADNDPRQALYPSQYWRGYHLQSVTFHYGICFIEKHPDAD
jgi:8-demethyl-8-(2-methoxy-alpha-L-rhamnosyl)tetracenomycin-C 3'-O-methyltransferase